MTDCALNPFEKGRVEKRLAQAMAAQVHVDECAELLTRAGVITVNDRKYSIEHLRHDPALKQDIMVQFHPDDPRFIKARIDGSWIKVAQDNRPALTLSPISRHRRMLRRFLARPRGLDEALERDVPNRRDDGEPM